MLIAKVLPNFYLIQGNIATATADVIVNAANVQLSYGSGVCGSIFMGAGKERLKASCQELAPIQTGQAVVTPGFNLSAKYIIHAVGPRYIDGTHNERALLIQAYKSALEQFLTNCGDAKSIVFPVLSAGIYGYPKQEAIEIAIDVLMDWCKVRYEREHEIEVALALYDHLTVEMSKTYLTKKDLINTADSNYEAKLVRFVQAQEKWYEIATQEILDGEKITHWIWFIFPQLQGIGQSSKSFFYGLSDLSEAKSYLNHTILGSALIEISEKLLAIEGRSANQIMGKIDALKLQSCMTLFDMVNEGYSVFRAVLEKYYNGERCDKTIELALHARQL